EFFSSKEVNLHRYAPFLLCFLAGVLFSNPAYADPPPLAAGTGQNLTVDSGHFPISSSPFPAILYANGGGAITTASGGLSLDISGNGITALEATGTGSKITADTVLLNGAGVGASVDSGGTISITGNSTFNVTKSGLVVGTGSIDATG